MVEEQKIAEKLLLFCVLHVAHDSESKTSMQHKNKTNTK